jgi:ribosomal protein S18 acetylase RimI-like enzyme
MGAMVLVREITADDWELMRDVRLAALAEAPSAFASTYAREAAFTEENWRGRISDRSVTFFAEADPASAVPAGTEPASAAPGHTEPSGLAGVFVDDGAAQLVSMWVRPSARGLRVGEALVEAAAAWAKERDFGSLSLWVTAGNAPAQRLYERCGFSPSGQSQPLPSDPTLAEIQMSRTL